jgi:hypothetical protein
MQFKVPQFIDVEDKLFGPFTFKQFVYMIGGGGMIFIAYKLLPFWIAVIFILPIGLLTFLLTFYRINNKPFSHYLQAGVVYFTSSRLYLWKQRLAKPGEGEVVPQSSKVSSIPQSSGDRIRNISQDLDVPKQEN